MRGLKEIHNCNRCLWGDKCHRNNGCRRFTPLDENEYTEDVIEIIKENNIPSEKTKLSRAVHSGQWAAEDKTPTLDSYYVKFINGVLSSIRKGDIDYVFNVGQLAELFRFEPNMNASYHDGSWSVWLDCIR